jgi:hypothetical protein
MDTLNTILTIIFGVTTIAGLIVSIVFYYRQRLSQKDLQTEKERLNELRTIIHWQLQAIHHECNRIENIMLDPERPDRGVIEVARGIRDSADSLMGQLVGEVYVFPWANAPIRDPKTKKDIGRLVGTLHRYVENYETLFPEVHKGAYKEDSQKRKSED